MATGRGNTRRDLHRLVKFYGITGAELGQAWGMGETGVSNRFCGTTSPNLEHLEITLELLGIRPAEFLRGVETRFHPEFVASDLYRDKHKRLAVSRFLKRHLKRTPEKEYSAAELREMADDLEALRLRDGRATRHQALEILRTPGAAPDVAAEAWGVLAVLERLRGMLHFSGYCFAEALRARPGKTVRARNLQRIAMLLLFTGDPKRALEAISRARHLYVAAGDDAGYGKTLVDEGAAHFISGDHHQAHNAYLRALRYLGEKNLEHRFAALQSLAITAVFLGNAREALHYLDQATAQLAEDETLIYLRSSVRWLQGEIALLLHQYGEASDHFVAVWDAYLDLDFGPLEVTLISLRMAKAYCLAGDRPRLRQILQDLVAHENQVQRSNPLLAPVLGELLRESQEAITAELLEEIYQKMREGAETAPPSLPVTLPAS